VRAFACYWMMLRNLAPKLPQPEAAKRITDKQRYSVMVSQACFENNQAPHFSHGADATWLNSPLGVNYSEDGATVHEWELPLAIIGTWVL